MAETQSSDPLVFYRTLIEGSAATKGRTQLTDMLHAAIHDGVPAGLQERLLKEMLALVSGASASLPAHMYWYLTEPLWLERVAAMEFGEFAVLLEHCSRQVGEEGWQGRLVLLTNLIRRTAVIADEDWFDTAWTELTESYNQLTPWHQSEVDLMDWLFTYRDERDAFLAPHEFRQALDRALVAILAGDELLADRAFLEAQVACLDQREALFEAFRPNQSSGIGFQLLHWYAREVVTRRGLRDDAMGSSMITRRVEQFTNRIERRSSRTVTHYARNIVLLFLLYLSLVAVVQPWVLVNEHGGREMPLLWAIPVATTGFAVWAFRKGWFGVVFSFFRRPFERRLHNKIWREMTADFLLETHIPLQQVMEEVQTLVDDGASLDEYQEAVNDDEALFLYSTALQFAE